MTPPTASEGAPEMPPDVKKEYGEMLSFINSDPITQSLLYDLDLLPEQIDHKSRDLWKMVTVVSHMAKAQQQPHADLTRLRTSHGKLVDAMKLLEPIHTAANRVLELYRAQYMRGNNDGGRVAHAMTQLQSAVGTASKLYPREVVRQATAASGEGKHTP